ncbi:mitochondrial 37S ribosomal protein uS5m [Aspergillus luchuensis]|uniref:Small ribosomal subunit protein uS5m n=1 Tax=Aspergillus kawachii TaxID=1069201 RepID=A0A146F6J5_ASPKA|nr:28S ribosomal protein S5, mitochondrial [Aspergillus luchuensis]BCR97945.1 28S ribosomal protein S5, mitochondrial [Aspergillus luchuensis]BCS10396.1 28S ribosomal protein S5, mitochondrial [Aspergillus luchuensis]GAA83341.1 37S ribosomal protein S5 [Aspergillus luchuensis IFO 4308]GAT21429.1 37S ribosomal protein S5 [Aspergillus luchuensis]
MSLARPARCLFCSFSRAASAGPRVPSRQFHLSSVRLSDQKPKVPEVNKAPEGKTLDEIYREVKLDDFKHYTEEEKAALREHYTPEQIAAIEAGEKTIDPKDLAEQFRLRRDPMRLKYLDDFSVIEPGVDKHVRAPKTNSDYNATFKTEDDFMEDFARFFAESSEDPQPADFVRFLETNRVTHGKEEHELNGHSALSPNFLKDGETLEHMGDEIVPRPQYRTRFGELTYLNPEEPNEAEKRLFQVTGYGREYIKSLYIKDLVIRRVSNQTRLGKVPSMSVVTVAGNQNGLMGIGIAKSDEIVDACQQARARAVKNMQPVPRYEKRTIFGDVEGKVGAVELKLMHRPPGFGLRCQHLIFEMCRAAGIHDIAARVNRSRNPMNTVKAAYEALMSQRNPEDIARARGKKMVDVRGVYYSGKGVLSRRERRTA